MASGSSSVSYEGFVNVPLSDSWQNDEPPPPPSAEDTIAAFSNAPPLSTYQNNGFEMVEAPQEAETIERRLPQGVAQARLTATRAQALEELGGGNSVHMPVGTGSNAQVIFPRLDMVASYEREQHRRQSEGVRADLGSLAQLVNNDVKELLAKEGELEVVFSERAFAKDPVFSFEANQAQWTLRWRVFYQVEQGGLSNNGLWGYAAIENAHLRRIRGNSYVPLPWYALPAGYRMLKIARETFCQAWQGVQRQNQTIWVNYPDAISVVGREHSPLLRLEVVHIRSIQLTPLQRIRLVGASVLHVARAIITLFHLNLLMLMLVDFWVDRAYAPSRGQR